MANAAMRRTHSTQEHNVTVIFSSGCQKRTFFPEKPCHIKYEKNRLRFVNDSQLNWNPAQNLATSFLYWTLPWQFADFRGHGSTIEKFKSFVRVTKMENWPLHFHNKLNSSTICRFVWWVFLFYQFERLPLYHFHRSRPISHNFVEARFSESQNLFSASILKILNWCRLILNESYTDVLSDRDGHIITHIYASGEFIYTCNDGNDVISAPCHH